MVLEECTNNDRCSHEYSIEPKLEATIRYLLSSRSIRVGITEQIIRGEIYEPPQLKENTESNIVDVCCYNVR